MTPRKYPPLNAALLLCLAVCLSDVSGEEPLSVLSQFPAAEIFAPSPNDAPLLVGPVVTADSFHEGIPNATGVDLNIPPLEAEQAGIGWLPDWMDPRTWRLPALWEKSFELGISGSKGNAEAFSIRTGLELSRETELTNWDIAITYRKAEAAGGLETQHNALVYSDLDIKLNKPRWSWFNKLGMEYDEFKAFDVRVNYNTGFGYLLIDAPLTQLRPRFGAGTSREIGGPDDTWKPEAVFGFDFSRHFSATQKFTIVCDYYPNWANFSDYRVVTIGGWEFILSEAHNLSLVLGLIDRYDSTPSTARPHDADYSVLLIWAM